jgi:hypothetical protein
MDSSKLVAELERKPYLRRIVEKMLKADSQLITNGYGLINLVLNYSDGAFASSDTTVKESERVKK